MSDPFKPVDRDTPYLLPPSLQDWLPQEHLGTFCRGDCGPARFE